MKSMFSVAWILALWALSVPLFAQDTSGDELLREVDRRMQPGSYEMYRKIINIEPDGRQREFVLYSVRKGEDKLAAVFLDPPGERGRSTLRLDENMWLYIPEVGRPIRITSLQSVTGGVFSNADILRLDFSTEYTATLEEDVGQRYVLDLRARGPAVAYDRLRMEIDKATLTPATIEAYAAGGMLIKTLRYSNITDFGHGIVRPSVLETDSPLHRGYRSVMLFSGITPRELPDEVFTLSYMARIGELRR